MFNAKIESENCTQWIKEWFENQSGGAKGVLINISGGKDSTVVAKLCVDALGCENVFGLLQPNGEQSDIQDGIDVCKFIGIEYAIVNIADTYNSIVKNSTIELTQEALINVSPRIRMTNAYAYAQSMGLRVAGTGNKSEAFIGYCTKWGDMACDFNPINGFTSDEVIAIGDEIGLPFNKVHKIPSDGLCGKSDEERFGFTYEILNNYIKTGQCSNLRTKAIIKSMNVNSRHKFNRTPVYDKYEFMANKLW